MSFIPPINPLELGRALGIGLRHLASAAKEPLDMYMSVAGAGQRGISGAISGKGVLPGVMNPGASTELTHAAERRLHLPVPGKGLGQGLEDFAFETATDPITYVPGADIFSILGRVGRAARFGERLTKASPILDRFADWALREKNSIHRGATRAGQDVVHGAEIAGRNQNLRRLKEYHRIADQKEGLESLERTLRTKGIPEQALKDINIFLNHVPIKERLALYRANKLTDAALWREGSPEARRRMLSRGFVPSSEDRNITPSNLVSRDFGKRYIPEHRISKTNDVPSEFKFFRGGVKKSQFDKEKKANLAKDPLFERFLDRLEKSAYLEPKRRTEQKIISELGLTPSQAKRTHSRLTELRDKLAITRKSSPEAGILKRAISKYEGLLSRQTLSAYQNLLRRDKYLKNGSPSEVFNLPGILRNRKTSEGSALRDIRFFGGNAKSAFSPEGKILSHTLTGVKSERSRSRISEAFRALDIAGSARKAERSLSNELSKAGLADQKRITGQVKNLRSMIAMRERREIESLEKAASHKKKPEKQTPNIFELPWLSNRNLSDKELASSPIMKRIAELRDRRAYRGGSAYLSLLNSLPSDTYKATQSVRNLSDRIGGEAGRRVAYAQKAAKEYHDLVAQNNAIKQVEKKIKNDPLHQGSIEMPRDIHNRIFGDVIKANPGPLRDLSDASREALFSITSLPHKKNISILQALGPAGLGGVMRGAKYAGKIKRGDPAIEDRVKALESIGGTEHHISNEESPFSRFGMIGRAIAGRSKKVSEALDRFDTGQRLALEDQLAKQGTMGYEAAGKIRDTLGDYHNTTPLIDMLRNQLGAPFPQWHLGIVPKAVGKAIVENPRGVHAMTRSEKLTNDDIVEPQFGARLNVGGPLDEGMQLYTSPFGAQKYFSSQSITGPIGQAGRDIDRLKRGQPGPVISDLARTYIPGAGLLEDLARLSPYQSPGSPAANAGLGLAGSYLTKPDKKPSPMQQQRQQLRDQLEIKGVPKKSIDMMLRGLTVR